MCQAWYVSMSLSLVTLKTWSSPENNFLLSLNNQFVCKVCCLSSMSSPLVSAEYGGLVKLWPCHRLFTAWNKVWVWFIGEAISAARWFSTYIIVICRWQNGVNHALLLDIWGLRPHCKLRLQLFIIDSYVCFIRAQIMSLSLLFPFLWLHHTLINRDKHLKETVVSVKASGKKQKCIIWLGSTHRYLRGSKTVSAFVLPVLWFELKVWRTRASD